MIAPELHLPPTLDGALALRLVEVVQQLAGARTAEAIHAVVTRAARTLAGAEGATLVLRDGGECHYVAEEAIGPLWRGQRFPLEQCISGLVMLSGQPITIPDVLLDPRIPQAAYAPTFVHSMVMVPIHHEAPVGAVGAYWATPHEATAAEVFLLQTLADSAAVAMERAAVLQELEDRVAERTAELAAANHELEAFSYSVAHDLRNPLGAIIGFADITLVQLQADLTPPVQRYLTRIVQEVERMDGRIEDYLMLARATRATIQPEWVDLAAKAREFIAQRDAIARFDVPAELLAWGDRGLLRALMENLLSNALKFCPEGSVPWIELGQDAAEPEIFFLRDHGVGFDMAEADRLFKPFQRLSSAMGTRGSGIGLATVARILERHQGRVWAEGELGQGATFRFRLPAP